MNWRGCKAIRTEVFVRLCRGRLLAVELGAEPIAFPIWADNIGKYPWRTMLLELLLPYGPRAMDCVGVTVECLRRAGVSVPRRVNTPARLLRLLGRTHEVERLDG